MTRDGTQYGQQEVTLEEMVKTVERQLGTGEVVIVFDETSETCTIVPKEQCRSMSEREEDLPSGT